LIYLPALPRFGGLGNFDVYISQSADTPRVLVEARSDGATHLLCAWGPGKLPEHRL
jgi:hypothetical protein